MKLQVRLSQTAAFSFLYMRCLFKRISKFTFYKWQDTKPTWSVIVWYRELQSESSLVNFHNYLAPIFVMFRASVSFSLYLIFYTQYKMGLILPSLKFFCVEMGLFLLFSPNIHSCPCKIPSLSLFYIVPFSFIFIHRCDNFNCYQFK